MKLTAIEAYGTCGNAGGGTADGERCGAGGSAGDVDRAESYGRRAKTYSERAVEANDFLRFPSGDASRLPSGDASSDELSSSRQETSSGSDAAADSSAKLRSVM